MNERLIDTYVSSVQALWPGTPEPRLRRSRGSGRAPGRSGDEIELAVLPNAAAPRLLVPVGNPTAAARAMLRFSAALSNRDTVKRVGVSALLRARADAAFPDRIVVAERAGSMRSYLSDVFGEQVDFSLGLGTARANRKPVLQVFDARGRSLAFVKIGDTEVTEALVRREARVAGTPRRGRPARRARGAPAAAPRHLGGRHRRRHDGAGDHLLAAPQATVRRPGRGDAPVRGRLRRGQPAR